MADIAREIWKYTQVVRKKYDLKKRMRYPPYCKMAVLGATYKLGNLREREREVAEGVRRRQPTLGEEEEEGGKRISYPRWEENEYRDTTEKILFVERIKRSVKQGLHCSVSIKRTGGMDVFKIRGLGCG